MNTWKKILALAILGILFTGCQPKKNKSDTSNPSAPLQANSPHLDLEKYCKGLSASKCRSAEEPRCKYDEKEKLCVVASADEINDCGSIGLEKDCIKAQGIATYGCRWDDTVTPPICIKNNAPTTVYVWQKLPNLNDQDEVSDFKKVVMSGDGQNLYVLNSKNAAGSIGLWHKALGAAWVSLNAFSPSAPRVGASSTDGMALGQDDINNLDLHATKTGAVITKGSQVMILRGSEPVWALDSQKHHAQALGADKYEDIEANSPITFSKVVETPGYEALLFQQARSEDKKLLFQSTINLEQDLKSMSLRTSDNKALKVALHAARNDADKGLMLGGENFTTTLGVRANKWVVHHILAANNNPGEAQAGFTNSPHSQGVLFSSPDLVATIWPNDATSAMTLVGQWGNFYFANRNGSNSGSVLGGLFSHQGAQQPANIVGLGGSSPVITFEASSIIDLNIFEGVLRVVTRNQGLLGIGADLKPDPVRDFKFSSFAKLEEMMSDKSAVVLNDEDNIDLLNILTSPELSKTTYFVVKNKGIFARHEILDQPRLK